MMEKTLYKRACTHCGHMTGQFHYNDEEVERLEKVVEDFDEAMRGDYHRDGIKIRIVVTQDSLNKFRKAKEG